MLEDLNYTIDAKLWVYKAKATWYFVNIPKDESDEIKFFSSDIQRGWKSVPVKVTVGATQWKTSLFPSTESGGYILPIKAEVRKKEKIGGGDMVTFELKMVG